MAELSPLGCFGKLRLSQRVHQILKQQNSPRASLYHYHALLFFFWMQCYLNTSEKSFTFGLIILQNVSKTILNILFAQQWFSLGNSARQALFVQSLFFHDGSMTSDLMCGKGGMQLFGCCWVFYDLLDEVNLVVGSLTTVWITDDGSCCGSLESKDFKIYFVTLLRLIDLNYFLSYCCTWISVDLCMMFSIWGSFGVLHFVIEILPDKVMSWFKRWSWLKQW